MAHNKEGDGDSLVEVNKQTPRKILHHVPVVCGVKFDKVRYNLDCKLLCVYFCVYTCSCFGHCNCPHGD